MNTPNADSNTPEYAEVETLVCDTSFQAYCMGSDPQAQNYWEQWYRDHPDKKSSFLQARHIVEILSARQGNRKKQVDHFQQGFHQAEDFRRAFNHQERRLPFRRGIRTWAAAAAVLFMMGVGWGIYNHFSNDRGSHTRVLLSEEQHQGPVSNQSILIYTTEGLDKRTVLLSDGSTVTLRKNAVLSVLPEFGNRIREVKLRGEAYFRVSHNPALPFLVQTDQLTTKVLGTEFNVKNDVQAHETRVLLIKGKVEVALHRNPEEKVVLLPNQVYQSSDGVSGEKQAIEVEEELPETQWIKTRFQIENMPLEEIATLLEEAYGVRIRFEQESPKHYRYTGTFETEGLLEALNALQLSYPFKYEISGQTIRIRP